MLLGIPETGSSSCGTCRAPSCRRWILAGLGILGGSGSALREALYAQGYLVYSSKQKLKPELAGLPGNVIRDRRLAGEVGA